MFGAEPGHGLSQNAVKIELHGIESAGRDLSRYQSQSREEQLRDTMVRKSWRSEERRNHAWKATSGVSALFWRAAYAR